MEELIEILKNPEATTRILVDCIRDLHKKCTKQIIAITLLSIIIVILLAIIVF